MNKVLESGSTDNVKNKTKKKQKHIILKKDTIDGSQRRKSVFSSLPLEMDTVSPGFQNRVMELDDKHEFSHNSHDVRNAVDHDVSPVIGSVSTKTQMKMKKVKKISLCDRTLKHPSKKSEDRARTLSYDEVNNDLNVSVSSPLADKSEINRDLRTIYVGNLPVDFKKKKLLKMMKQYGKVEKMWTRGAKPLLALPKKVALIKRKFHEKQPPLMVHAVFETVGEAHNALKLNGELYEGCRLRVTMVKEKVFDSRKGVFVGNLPFEVKDDDLFDFFLQCGEIMNVRVVRDEKTGAGKGFGYVNFESADSVELALNLTAVKLNGREIRVQRVLSAGKKKKLDKKQGKSLLEVKAVSLDKKSFPPSRSKSANAGGRRNEIHPIKSVGLGSRTQKFKRKVTDLKKIILAKKLSIKSRKNSDSS